MRRHRFEHGACLRCFMREDWPGSSGPCVSVADAKREKQARWRERSAAGVVGVVPPSTPRGAGPGRERITPRDNAHARKLARGRADQRAFKERFIAEHGLDAWRARVRGWVNASRQKRKAAA